MSDADRDADRDAERNADRNAESDADRNADAGADGSAQGNPTTRTDRLRLSVSGAADLVVELDTGPGSADVARAGESPRARPTVEPLPVTADDAAAGVRRFEVVVDGWRFEVAAERADRAALRERAQRAGAVAGAAVIARLRAQIPGRVTRVWVADGDKVEQGQRLLNIEAMKMENEIRAPRGGTVEGLRVAEGQLVELNDELLSIG